MTKTRSLSLLLIFLLVAQIALPFMISPDVEAKAPPPTPKFKKPKEPESPPGPVKTKFPKKKDTSTSLFEETGELKLSKWKGDAQLKIKTPDPLNTSEKLPRKKTKLTYDDYVINVYPSGEGIEYEIVLDKPPKSNIFYLDISSENLEFYYQPPLNEIEYPEGWAITETHAYNPEGVLVDYRPPEIVGSYAIYHSSKINNEYEAGKFVHLYRPRVISSGTKSTLVVVNKTYSYWRDEYIWTWADLYYNETTSQFEITIDKEWLEKAKYPVVIDPWFGYRTKGETESIMSGIIGASLYASTKFTVRGITAYIKYDTDAIVEYGIYNSSNFFRGNTYAWSIVSGWDGWKKLNADPNFGVNATNNYLCIWTSSNTYYYYDSGGATAKYHTRVYDGNWPTPITWTSWTDRRISIYADNTTLAAIPINVAAGIVNPEGCGPWVFQGSALYNFRGTYLCADGADQITETGIGFYDGVWTWYAVYHNITSDQTSLTSPDDGIRAMQSNYTMVGEMLTVDYWLMFDPPIADVLVTPIYMYSLTNTTSTGWETPLAAAPGAGVTGFSYFKPVVVDSILVDSDLYNKTILVHLDSSFEWTHVQSDGDDIRFVDLNGTNLNYELERWNHTNYADIWVRVPTITAMVNTMFIMFYGNPTAVSASNPEGTWNQDYVMVQHLNDWVHTSNDNRTGSSPGDVVDSTANNNDGDLFWLNTSNLPSGLQGWWAFEDGNASATITDLSANTNTGTWKNKAVGDHNTSLSYDGLDECGYFDGVNDYVSVGNDVSLRGMTDLTIEAWIYGDKFVSYAGIVSSWSAPNQLYILGYFQGGSATKLGTIALYVYNGTKSDALKSNTNLNLNEWYHVVGVFKGGTSITIYINGVEDVTKSTTVTKINNLATAATVIGIYASYEFDGLIDDVRIYNRTLSSEEIRNHYRQWRTDGQIDGAMWFRGASYVDCGTDASLQGMTDLTIEAWVRGDAFSNFGSVVSSWVIPRLYIFGYFQIGPVTKLGKFNLFVDDGVNGDVVQSNSTLDLDAWYYMVGVLDGGSSITLYLNGVVDNSKVTIVTGINAAGMGESVRLGRYLPYFFNGTIDEIRISNVTRSAASIKVSYYSEINQLLTFGIERGLLATVTFNVYNEGGQTEYSTHGDGLRIAGGSVFDLAAMDSSLNSWARGNVTYRKFQHVRLLVHWWQETAWDAVSNLYDCPSEHAHTGYVEFGVDYCHNDTWMEGWKLHMEIEDGRVGQGWANDASWVMINCSWYNRGIYVKSDYITAYYDSYRQKDNLTQFSIHVDLWVDRENASSTVGGRVNSEYFGMVQRGIWWTANWEPKKAQQEKSFLHDDMLGYGVRVISAKSITLYKIWALINKTDPDAGGPDCDSHQWAITEYEDKSVLWLEADEPMRGISEPIYTKTQVISLATPNMIAALVTALIDGIGKPLQQILYESAPSAGRSFVELIASSFRRFGDTTGLGIPLMLVNMGRSFMIYVGSSITNVTSIILSIFSLFTSIAGFTISWFVRIINVFIAIINVVNALLRGTATLYGVITGVGDVFVLMNLSEWIDAVPIFMVIAWFVSIDSRAKTFGQWIGVFWGDIQIIISVISYLLDMFLQLINLVIDLVFRFLDYFPITGA